MIEETCDRKARDIRIDNPEFVSVCPLRVVYREIFWYSADLTCYHSHDKKRQFGMSSAIFLSNRI